MNKQIMILTRMTKRRRWKTAPVAVKKTQVNKSHPKRIFNPCAMPNILQKQVKSHDHVKISSVMYIVP